MLLKRRRQARNQDRRRDAGGQCAARALRAAVRRGVFRMIRSRMSSNGSPGKMSRSIGRHFAERPAHRMVALVEARRQFAGRHDGLRHRRGDRIGFGFAAPQGDRARLRRQRAAVAVQSRRPWAICVRKIWSFTSSTTAFTAAAASVIRRRPPATRIWPRWRAARASPMRTRSTTSKISRTKAMRGAGARRAGFLCLQSRRELAAPGDSPAQHRSRRKQIYFCAVSGAHGRKNDAVRRARLT